MNTALKLCGNDIPTTKIKLMCVRFHDRQKILKYSSRQCNFTSIRSNSTFREHELAKTFLRFPTAATFLSKGQPVRLLSISNNSCWKCHGIVAERDLVCMSCGSVQELKEKLNYFELFKEIPHYDIDTRTLSVKFRRLQTLLHPDKFATRPEIEKGYSAEQSALVNKAYQTLLRPIDRGLYLLELNLKPLDENSIQMPAEFLADIMEINEAIDECKSGNSLEPIRHVNDAKLQMVYGEISLAFKEKNIDKARELLGKMKYFINIDEKIRKMEEKLGISRDD